MRLTINGENREVARQPAENKTMTVQALLQHLSYTKGRVAVELNGAIIPRAEHPRAAVGDGDVLEIVALVGGG